MIKITMKRLKHSVELELPTDYERVLLSLWRLGLDRDPGKYTLEELDAVFHYDTPEEYQMVRLIDSHNTLMYALISLHEMFAPPFIFAEELHKKLAEGSYNTAEDFYTDMEQMVFDPAIEFTNFHFPLSGELVDQHGNVSKAGDDVLLNYEYMIAEAMSRASNRSFYWKTELFSDIESVYKKLVSAIWMVERIGNRLFGVVSLGHAEPFNVADICDLLDKVELINSVDLTIRLKQWSVLTDDGLLYIYPCNHDGDYGIISPEDLYDDDEDDEVENKDPYACLCPMCRELMRNRDAALRKVLPEDELEESVEE